MDFESIYTKCNGEALVEKQLFKGPTPIYKSRKCKICGAHGEGVKLHSCGNREYICDKCQKSQEKTSAGSHGKAKVSTGKKFGESVFEGDLTNNDMRDLIGAADELIEGTDVGTYTVVDDHLEFTLDKDFMSQFDESPEEYLKGYFTVLNGIPVEVTTIASEEGFITCEVKEMLY